MNGKHNDQLTGSYEVKQYFADGTVEQVIQRVHPFLAVQTVAKCINAGTARDPIRIVITDEIDGQIYGEWIREGKSLKEVHHGTKG